MKFTWFRKKKFNHRREGSSLVSVVIGVLFLAAIGSTILTVATRYVVSVYTSKTSSSNFYETEGILTEVRTGLIEYAAEASKVSYEYVLEHYMEKDRNAKMRYSERFINQLVLKLTDKASFDVASEVNETNPSKSYQAENGASREKISVLTQVPAAVKTDLSTKEDYYDFDIQYDKEKGYSLILRNLNIDYTNDAHYRSQITTDVVFNTPDYKFDGDSTFNELKNYLVISDGILKREGTTSSGKTSFTGNIYTGGAESKTSTDKPDAGISVENGMKVDFNADRIITRGSFDVYNGSEVMLNGDSGTTNSVAGDLWVQNIRLKNRDKESYKGKTSFKMFENAYVSNDLDIEDDNASVYLAGTYYGYSYNEKNESSEAATNAEYSSAVLVNGLNTSLYTNWDPSQDNNPSPSIPTLDKLVLAGHTFVERKTGDAAGNDDIIMGESIAAKSDQIAYLVPDDYITGVEHNPVLQTDYQNKGAFLANVKTALNNSPLKEYLNTSQPYIENHIQAGDVDLMYLFLNFKSISKANDYFYDYFAGKIHDPSIAEEDSSATNKDALKEKAQTYLRATNMSATFSPNLYLLAGYIAYNYDATDAEDGIQSPDYFTSGNNGVPKPELLEDARGAVKSYYAYCRSLTPSWAETGRIKDTKAEERLVAGSILEDLQDDTVWDISKVEKNTTDNTKIKVDAVDGNYSTSTLMDTAGIHGDTIRGIVVATGNVTVDADFRGLIIADGKVTVEKNFDGLILAKDSVSVQRDKELKANIVILSELLDYIKADPELSKIFKAFNGKVSEDPTELEQCITYQNWKKDVGPKVTAAPDE